MNTDVLTWRKASRSTNNGGACVELASLPGAVAVRDSKDPDGPRIVVDRRGFVSLVNAIKG